MSIENTADSKPKPEDDVRYKVALTNYFNEFRAAKNACMEAIKSALTDYNPQDKATEEEFIKAFVKIRQICERQINKAKEKNRKAVLPIYEELDAIDYRLLALSFLKHFNDPDQNLTAEKIIEIYA